MGHGSMAHVTYRTFQTPDGVCTVRNKFKTEDSAERRRRRDRSNINCPLLVTDLIMQSIFIHIQSLYNSEKSGEELQPHQISFQRIQKVGYSFALCFKC